MNNRYTAFALVGLFLASGETGWAQYSNKSSVLDSLGAQASGGGITNISAVGQPSGIATATGGCYFNQSGFLNTFMLQPGLDTDQDGLPDELDPDNDNDELTDAAEIDGSGFTPSTPTSVNLADTDGDGCPDGLESAAGTDPNNQNAAFELVAISNAVGDFTVAWLARGNNEKIYVVRAASDASQPYSTVLFSNTVAGGSAPWFMVTASVDHACTSNAQFYAIGVQP